jgi:peroxiredoxin Q/BCP
VVGISSDRPKAQSRFAERLELTYPMLCDPEGEVLRAYGVRGMTGHARRVTFLVDGEGKVHKVYPKVSPKTHATEVLEDLKSLAG